MDKDMQMDKDSRGGSRPLAADAAGGGSRPLAADAAGGRSRPLAADAAGGGSCPLAADKDGRNSDGHMDGHSRRAAHLQEKTKEHKS